MSIKLIDIIDTTDMEIINWLRANKDRLSFRAIEKELGIPDTTLSKAVNGTQELPKKWVEPLTKLRMQMCGGKK